MSEHIRRKIDGIIFDVINKKDGEVLVMDAVWQKADMYEFNDKETLKKETLTLELCPFCGRLAEFTTDKSGHLIIKHEPDAGSSQLHSW